MICITQSADRKTPETSANLDTRIGRLERLAELAEHASREYCARLTARRCEAGGEAKMTAMEKAP
jgi:hypothetical protein